MMKSYIFLLLTTVLISCGDTSSLTSPKQEVEVVVYGTYAQPTDASGNAAPIFYELALESLVLVPENGTDLEFTPTSTETLRVIDRPQRVFKDDIGDYEGESFRQVQIYFNDDVTVGGKYRDDYALTLAEPILFENSDFTIKKGKGVKIEIKIEWQNTIVRDADASTEEIQQPNFAVSVGD